MGESGSCPIFRRKEGKGGVGHEGSRGGRSVPQWERSEGGRTAEMWDQVKESWRRGEGEACMWERNYKETARTVTYSEEYMARGTCLSPHAASANPHVSHR